MVAEPAEKLLAVVKTSHELPRVAFLRRTATLDPHRLRYRGGFLGQLTWEEWECQGALAGEW